MLGTNYEHSNAHAGFTLVEDKLIEGFKENYFLKFRKN